MTAPQPDDNDPNTDDAPNTNHNATTLAHQIADALTTTPHPNDRKNTLLTALQADRIDNDPTNTGTDRLVATARDIGLLDDTDTVALKRTRLNHTTRPDSSTDAEQTYATVSVVNDDAAIILAASPFPTFKDNPTHDIHHTPHDIIDDLLAHARDIISVEHVLAGRDLYYDSVLDVFHDHDVTYTVAKPLMSDGDGHLSDDIVSRYGVSAAFPAIAPDAPSPDNPAVLYASLSDTDDTRPTKAIDNYRAFLTTQPTDSGDVTDTVTDHIADLITVELQAATLRDLVTTEPSNNTTPPALPSFDAATATYNYWQLSRGIDSQTDGDLPDIPLTTILHDLSTHLASTDATSD